MAIETDPKQVTGRASGAADKAAAAPQVLKPRFDTLRAHYPATETQAALFTDIGWTDLIGNPAYDNTCAIRMSTCLLRAGVTLPGARMQAKAGTIRGKWIEPGQAKLSNILKTVWGLPEIYTGEDAVRAGVKQRHGVVSFFRIDSDNGGHIDLIGTDDEGRLDCARSCFLGAAAVWFWPLL